MRWQTTALEIGGVTVIRTWRACPYADCLGAEAPTRKKGRTLGLPSNVDVAKPSNAHLSILSKLSELVRGKFGLVGAARDNPQPPSSLGVRQPIIHANTLSQLTSLAQGTAPDIRREWTGLRTKYESLLPQRERVDSAGGQLFLDNTPFWGIGGGSQCLLALLREVEAGPDMMGIEEPENHLHPELVKKALRYFQEKTAGADGRQLFVSTHSPFFVDSRATDGVVGLQLDGVETTAQELATRDDLRKLLINIGARPSDILFADVVLFVEGESDKIVLLNWARRLGSPLEDAHVSVISVKGMNKTRYHLKLWCEVAQHTGIPCYVLLDKGGETEVKKVVDEGLLPADRAHVPRSGLHRGVLPHRCLG